MSISLADSVAVTQALIRAESVTPASVSVFDLLEGWLKDIGFEVSRPVFSEDGTPDVENLYARIGNTRPHLMFAGHVDVVPVGAVDAWSHGPFSGDIADGHLYGRGAVDMKGGVGAFISAVARYLKKDSGKGTVSLLITGDEEGPAINGSVKLLEWAKARGEVWDHCILGEPTNTSVVGDVIKVGRRGSLTGKISIIGQQGHVAYPHLAANPVPELARVVSEISDLTIDDGTDVFQPTNLEFVTFDVGNPANNVIPNRADAKFNIRFNDLQSPQSLELLISRRLSELVQAPFEFILEFEPCNSHVFRTDATGILEKLEAAIEDVTGMRPELTTGGGTSDGRFIKDYCPIIEFGLVGQTMHKVDERTPLEDLQKLSDIYEKLLIAYFE